jgi:hypothetical protein
MCEHNGNNYVVFYRKRIWTFRRTRNPLHWRLRRGSYIVMKCLYCPSYWFPELMEKD